MIIKKIKLSNFRQFYGEHELEFSVGDKNSTLIIGENGSGKTSIFRALMFVIYGEAKLLQDGNAQDIHLVNLHKLHEVQDNVPVIASVELLFEHKGVNYKLERSYSTIRNVYGFQSRMGDAKLWEFGSAGDLSPKSMEKNEIDLFVNSIIDNKIRDFFFFDAERIDLLDTTKTNRALSADVKEGIIRLLQIKFLEESIKALKDKVIELQRDIKRKINDEKYDEITNELEQKKKNLEQLENKQIDLRKEVNSIQEEINRIDEILSKNESIRETQEKIYSKKNEKQALEDSRNLLKKESKRLLESSINFLGTEILSRNKAELQESLKTRIDNVPLNLLKESLFSKTCMVCKTNFEESSSQHAVIVDLIERYETSQFTSIANSIIEYSDSLVEQKTLHLDELRDTIASIVNNEEKIESLILGLEQLNREIGDTAASVQDLEIYDKKREELLADQKNREDSLLSTNYSIERTEEELKSLQEQLARLSKRFEEVRKEREIKEKVEHFVYVLESTMKDYTSSITRELSDTVYKTFNQLINEKNRANYESVIINDKYEIHLIDRSGNNVVQDLSMGQGQIFSLAFVLSLAKLASKGRAEIMFPLFMDTPLARLDRVNRENVIENVPNLTHQLIFLLTDTELTELERTLFERHDTVENIYHLVNANGRTRIERIDNLTLLS